MQFRQCKQNRNCNSTFIKEIEISICQIEILIQLLKLHCDVINVWNEFLEELRNIKLQVDMLCQVALKAQTNTKVLISNFKVLLDIVWLFNYGLTCVMCLICFFFYFFCRFIVQKLEMTTVPTLLQRMMMLMIVMKPLNTSKIQMLRRSNSRVIIHTSTISNCWLKQRRDVKDFFRGTFKH